MSVISSKLAEIALINLYYAEAELVVYGDSDGRLHRVQKHIQEAQAMLRVIAPGFVDGFPDTGEQSEEAEAAA